MRHREVSLISIDHYISNKAIRDGRPRPPRHQVGWDIVRRECACQISWWSVEKWRRYYILEFRGNTFRWLMTLTFDLKFWKYLSVTEKSYSMCMSSFMMIGWEMAEILHIEISWKHVSVTYDLDFWPKILKIFVSHGVPIRNMYAKFHNDRLRNTQTNRHGHYNTSPSPYGGRGNNMKSMKDYLLQLLHVLLYRYRADCIRHPGSILSFINISLHGILTFMWVFTFTVMCNMGGLGFS